MDLGHGEFAVYLGPSGCGKTTLMRIVGGLETASGGEVYLAGQKVTGPDRQKGMVFQAYTSFPWLTVLENIRFGTKLPERHRQRGEGRDRPPLPGAGRPGRLRRLLRQPHLRRHAPAGRHRPHAGGRARTSC